VSQKQGPIIKNVRNLKSCKIFSLLSQITTFQIENTYLTHLKSTVHIFVKVEIPASAGLSVPTYQTIKHHIPEDSNLPRLSLSFVFLSLAPNLTFFLICLIPLSASSSLLRIVTSEVTLQRTESDQRGSLIGSGQSMPSVARLIAPFCSGLAYDVFGSYGISVLRTAVTAAAVALCTILCMRQRKEKLL